MRKEMFKPYRDFLLKVLWSIETNEQLQIGSDMIYRFTSLFRIIIPHQQLDEAYMELQDVLAEKTNEINPNPNQQA